MKILSPDNIFTRLLLAAVPRNSGAAVEFLKSSLIAPAICEDKADVALIPSCDLIRHQDLLVSRDVAVIFDGQLSNSYYYFPEGQNEVRQITLAGDISLNEIILSKVLFRERYSSEIEISLTPTEEGIKKKNCLVAGDDNYRLLAPRDSAGKFEAAYFNGLSFGDEIATMLFMPYVNFIAVSKSEEKLKEFARLTKKADKHMEKYLAEVKEDEIFGDISLADYVRINQESVYFTMTELETDSLEEMLRLPYYHGIAEEPFEIKFV